MLMYSIINNQLYLKFMLPYPRFSFITNYKLQKYSIIQYKQHTCIFCAFVIQSLKQKIHICMSQPQQQSITTTDSTRQPEQPTQLVKQEKQDNTEQVKKEITDNNQPQAKKQKEKEKDKTITLTIKQMNKIRKQLEKMETLKKENQELTKYIGALEKKMEEGKKNETSKQAMEETIKHLQKMVDQSSKNEQKARKQEAKYKQIYKHERQMLNSLKQQVQQLRRVSSQYFLLKQEVSRLNNQCIALREARDQYPALLKKYEDLETKHENIKNTVEQQKKDLSAERQLKQKLQAKLQSTLQANKEMMKEKNRVLCEKEQVCGELQALRQQLEDQRMDFAVKEKKVNNQLKQLKVTLHQQHQKLKLTEHQLQQSRKNTKPQINLDKVKLSSLQKQDLFNLLQQSEMKIVSLKIALKDAGQRLQQQIDKIKDKDQSLMALARELTKDYPDLDQSQGMDYIEKDIIQMGKLKKDDWGSIVEKVMIQNLRLKSSVTALGEEYNLMMRLDKDKK